MLTKEESKELLNNLRRAFNIEEPEISNVGDFLKLYDCVNEFTEKPKREIHVGDIYRNMKGMIIEIVSKEEDSQNVKCKSGKSYAEDEGWYQEDDCIARDPRSLDLSKRYKLVEIKDE